MKNLFLILIAVLCSVSTFGQFSIDLGNDTTYCADPNTSSIPMGIKVNIKNGVEPYTYAWETKIIPYGYQKPQSASDVLSDSTLISPTLINSVWLYAADKTKFILHVTDHAGNTAKDSLIVSFSAWGSILGYQVIELAQGDSIFLNAGTPGGRIANFYLKPFEGLSTPNSPSSWCKPTVSTDYYSVLVDTSGCMMSNLAYQIIIIPTSSEAIQSNADYTIQQIQKGSKVYFNNKKNREALVSVFTPEGKLLHQCTTTDESYDISPDVAKNGIYLVKIALEGKVGVCKYYRY